MGPEMDRPLPYPSFPAERYDPPWSASGAPISAMDAVLGPLLLEAGAAVSRRFGAGTAHRKADGTPVTEADHEAQEILISGLAAAFPEDGVEAEEGGRRHGGPRRWFVDPIDGTASFSEGLAYWGPCVAALEDGATVVGALWLPRIREYYFFEAGAGAFRNGAALPPLATDGPDPGRLSVLYVPSRLHAGARVDWPGKLRCLGSVAAHLALVAAGCGLAALIPAGWQPWDTAAGLALIHAVGGRAVLANGQPFDPARHVGLPFAAGTPAALRWLSAPGRIELVTPERAHPQHPSRP